MELCSFWIYRQGQHSNHRKPQYKLHAMGVRNCLYYIGLSDIYVTLLSDESEEFKITCDHRPFSVRFIGTANRKCTCAERSADQSSYMYTSVQQ